MRDAISAQERMGAEAGAGLVWKDTGECILPNINFKIWNIFAIFIFFRVLIGPCGILLHIQPLTRP